MKKPLETLPALTPARTIDALADAVVRQVEAAGSHDGRARFGCAIFVFDTNLVDGEGATFVSNIAPIVLVPFLRELLDKYERVEPFK